MIDAYADGHKYVFGKKAVVYGEEDFVIAMTGFLDEIGVEVILAASGGNSGVLKAEIEKCAPVNGKSIQVMGDLDYEKINELCIDMKPDLLVGNSKGYRITSYNVCYTKLLRFQLNLLGEYNIGGDAFELEALFEEIGIELVSTFSGNSTIKSMEYRNNFV